MTLSTLKQSESPRIRQKRNSDIGTGIKINNLKKLNNLLYMNTHAITEFRIVYILFSKMKQSFPQSSTLIVLTWLSYQNFLRV